MNTWSILLFNSIILFFFVLVITKYMKKKTLSRATPFDFISYAVIAIIITLISLNIIENIYFLFVYCIYLWASISVNKKGNSEKEGLSSLLQILIN